MIQKEHRLKTWPEYFKFISDGSKLFELRKDDRDFQVNDYVVLEEWDPETESYTGKSSTFIISYVLRGEEAEKFGLKAGYCVINLMI